MSAHKPDNFNDRLTSAAKAKTALLEKFRAKPGPDDPAFLERQATQTAVNAAREARIQERKAARVAEEVRLAAEKAALAAEQKARDVEEAARKAEGSARSIALAAQQKAARDARYAARAARKR